jgi:hypothetical protein
MLLVAMLAGGVASAQGLGSGLRMTTPGTGLEVESLVTDRFGVRGLLNGGLASYGYDEAGSRYGTAFLLADWHPYTSGFRLSGGLAYNQHISGTTRPGSGTIGITGSNYSISPIGLLDSRATFSKASPYVGVGWGLSPRAGSRLYFSADVGVLYQRPSASLIGHCGPALPASVCMQLQHDIRAEDHELRDASDDFRFYPVISVGFGLRF